MLKPGINVKLGVPLLFIVMLVSGLALYGGAQLVKQDEASADAPASDGPGGGPVGPGPVSVTIVARNLAFDLSTLTANAGSEFNVTLDNQDAGVLHNVAFYTDRSLSQPVQIGELLTGPATEAISFTAPAAPGTYFFRCDVHPDTMSGAFIVQ
ncbi:MAG TPA: cupredoxin domain-containing protein [Dehalococcoidia bacterium]|nr:cupredoxin domain-containing protein [Dehalococcoidia bacterium]